MQTTCGILESDGILDATSTIVNSRGEFGMSVLNFLTRPGEIAETNYGRVAGCRMHFML